MIRRIVDFALNQRLFMLAFALLLFAGGMIAFHRLPVEAYPDVAEQLRLGHHAVAGPGRGRGGAAGDHSPGDRDERHSPARPSALRIHCGLSVVILIFDDDSDNDWNRQKVLERLSMVNLPRGPPAAASAPIAAPWARSTSTPCGSTNPGYDAMELKSLRGLGARETVQDRARTWSTCPASAVPPANTRCESTRTSSSPTA